MNQFGGNWTNQKIDIIESYAKAYLKVMQNTRFELIYFDGFAGSGTITQKDMSVVEGGATRIMSIESKKNFKYYYFVELIKKYAENLEKTLTKRFPDKKIYVVREDCNKKLISMAEYLRQPENKYKKVLAFIDPKGMQVKWEAIEKLKDLGIDMWILVPTGIGLARLLKKQGEIPDTWFQKISEFLGLPEQEIKKRFYPKVEINTLFGEITQRKRYENIIERAANVYTLRLKDIFEYVSEPFIMRNSKNSPMYHFFLATNNKTALTIANDVIKPKYKL